MKHCLFRLASAIFLIAVLGCFAFAQGGGSSSSLAGTVVDQSGAVVPGAEVLVKNDATGAELKTVTVENGTFYIPSMSPGTYTATVTVPNFKKAEVKNIILVAGTPHNIRVQLQVGGTAETVVVQAGLEIVQSQSATIATTLVTNYISNLPLATRNAMDFLVMLPGVNTTGGARASTISGMDYSALNITVDGVNTQDNYLKNDMFSYIHPRLDAIQEVTVSTATPGAESSGTGAVQIKFITRSGNNEYHGSAYEYHRNPALNSNYWFNNRDKQPTYYGDGPSHGQLCTPQQVATEFDKCKAARDRVLFNQPGGRIGGPISLPKKLFGPLGFDGKDKAFFFVNYEQFRLPAQRTRSVSMPNPLIEQGNYVYLYQGGGTKEVRTVKLLGSDGLAAANGQVSTWDPTIQKLYSDIRASSSCGSCTIQSYPIVSDPASQTLLFTNKALGIRHYLTTRFDFNLTSRHRLEGSWSYQYFVPGVDMLNSLDPRYPDFPVFGTQGGNRFSTSIAVRSTLTPRFVNEARTGFNGGTTLWSANVNDGMFSGPIANYGGWRFTPSYTGAAYATSGTSRRCTPVVMFEDTLTWTKGAHNLSFGGSWQDVGSWTYSKTVLSSVSFGLSSLYDPAYVMFDATNGPKNFPGATTSQISSAASLYASMTGRVTGISGSANLNEITDKYAYQGPSVTRSHLREMGFFISDSWRMRPGLTLNYGARWEIQMPWVPLNNAYSWATPAEVWGPSGYNNLMKPGATGGVPTQVFKYNPGDPGYNQDYKSISPTIGFAWSPQARSGWVAKLVGSGGQTVFRGGFSIAYNRYGMQYFDSIFGSNPGGSIDASRSQDLGNLVTFVGTDVYPVLYRDKSRLGAPSFAASPVYPLTPSINDSINAFDPDIRTPYTLSWTFGYQREITRDTAIEIRYVANKSVQNWVQPNYNSTEYNMLENGWLNEFWLAQKNLYANMDAKRGTNFRYYGTGTGTYPLPITIAYLGGKLDPSDPASYTTAKLGTSQGGFFTNASYNGYLSKYSPNASSLASNLQGDATRRANAITAGLPSNFFLLNPTVQNGGGYIYGNQGWNKYDSMVVEVRRRLSKGLMVQANYTWAKSFGSQRRSFRRDLIPSLGGTLPHAFKATWLYELPIGSGRTLLGGTHGVVDRIIGGWEFQGTTRVQAGNLTDLGNVLLVGMTDADLQKITGLRFDDANKKIYYYPQDFLDQSYFANQSSVTNYSASNPMGFTYSAPTGRYIAPANSNSAGCYQVVSGDCVASHHYFRGPGLMRFDLSLVKRLRFSESKNFELRAEFLNAFNNINFWSPSTSVSSLGGGTVGSAYTDANQQQDPGGRLVQLVLRINF
ncbi:MAG: carboxypeptidase regulatory-like domain-containing protein [Acidobacteriia bacterium]|nr:carboxypeptidase regulatory-like domain-containing protein [Terriglobia bacterium]